MIKELMTSNRNKTEIDYDKIIKKEMERRKFINFTKDSVIENNQVDTLKNFINLVNSIIFAGFDYYYDKEFDSDLIKNAIDNNKKINILINEDHIEKLRSTLDCFPSIEFIDVDKKYYIWYKNTNLYFNLIPFKRKEDKVFIDEDNEDVIIKSKCKNYMGLAYKLKK